MAFSLRHIFAGDINNHSLKDFELDYNVSDIDSRMKLIKTELNKYLDEYGRNFFETFFDEHYKVNITEEDKLSSEINVCKKLEVFADYLLRSTEVRMERKADETKYYFFVNKEEFLKRTKKETALSGFSDLGQDKVIYFLCNKQGSKIKKSKEQKIFKEDFKGDSDLAIILNEYKNFIDLLNDSVGKTISKRRADVLKGQVNQDMIHIKNCLCGTFDFQNALPDTTVPEWDKFDYSNPEHIRLALYINKEFDMNDEVSFILMDLDIITKKLHKQDILTDRQFEVLSYLKLGYNTTEIAKELNVAVVTIHKIIKSMAKKIANYYKKLEG